MAENDEFHLDHAKIRGHFNRIGRFRILVVGRSNAGKTTLLQRVCNTTDLPEIFNSEGEKVKCPILPGYRTSPRVTDAVPIRRLILKSFRDHWRQVGRMFDNLKANSTQRGHHNIEDELIFRSNPGFVFHDSCGFEAGSVEELNLMKDFVTDRASTMQLGKRVHVVWWGCDDI